jgi:hypothetical protein
MEPTESTMATNNDEREQQGPELTPDWLSEEEDAQFEGGEVSHDSESEVEEEPEQGGEAAVYRQKSSSFSHNSLSRRF